jgi:hypothetical protein
LFSSLGLPRGKHTIRVVCASDMRINVQGFRVYA